ncbi:MAG: hypothetical protein KBF75_07320 [Saprospiraceae bacterium]|jgi:hypothetical protein|nr:hypothetical protein [Saprospiraceae bacterium]
MWNRFTTRNQWFTETIETIRTSGLTLIISIIRFFKTFIAEFGYNKNLGKTSKEERIIKTSNPLSLP